MLSRREQIVQSYIERVLALQQQKREAPSLEELKAIAYDLGMSEEELASAEAAAQSHLERGLGFSRYAQWSDAVSELKSAVALNPLSLPSLEALADAHRQLWLVNHSAADRQQAELYARRILEIDPKHEPSFGLLRDLNASKGPSQLKSLRRWYIMVLIVAVIVILGSIWYTRGSSDSWVPTPPQTETVGQSDPEPRRIPVMLRKPVVQSREWSVEGVGYIDQPMIGECHVDFMLKNHGKAVRSMEVKITAVDETGQVIATETVPEYYKRDAPIDRSVKFMTTITGRPDRIYVDVENVVREE